MLKSILVLSLLSGALCQLQADKQKSQPQQKDASQAEPIGSASHSYGSAYGRSGYGGYGGVDPRYYDRGDTPHFGLAGFPFGYERRYYGQNVVYDNSLSGFPLNYYNYQQDYGNSYGGNSYNKGSSYVKPQYRSGSYGSSYGSPKNYVAGSAYPGVEYGAYLNKPEYNGNSNSYYSLQYGY